MKKRIIAWLYNQLSLHKLQEYTKHSPNSRRETSLGEDIGNELDTENSIMFRLHRAENGTVIEVFPNSPNPATLPGLSVGNMRTNRNMRRLVVIPSGGDILGALATIIVSERMNEQ